MVYAVKVTEDSLFNDAASGSQTNRRNNISNNIDVSNRIADNLLGNWNSGSAHRTSGIFYGNFIYLPWLHQSNFSRSSWSTIDISQPLHHDFVPRDLRSVNNGNYELSSQNQPEPQLSYEVVLNRNQNDQTSRYWPALTEPFRSPLQYDQLSDRGSDSDKVEELSELDEDGCQKRGQNKTPRKPMKPRKSAEKTNPDFKGITFSLKTEFKRGSVHLKIDSEFSPCRSSRRKLRSKADVFSVIHYTNGSRECATDSESDEPPGKSTRVPYNFCTNHTSKQCASCSTRKTPLWRDAEDGTPLCNACGIRYKKYRLRCSFCWHIPRKGSKAYPRCARCGEMLRLSVLKKLF